MEKPKNIVLHDKGEILAKYIASPPLPPPFNVGY